MLPLRHTLNTLTIRCVFNFCEGRQPTNCPWFEILVSNLSPQSNRLYRTVYIYTTTGHFCRLSGTHLLHCTLAREYTNVRSKNPPPRLARERSNFISVGILCLSATCWLCRASVLRLTHNHDCTVCAQQSTLFPLCNLDAPHLSRVINFAVSVWLGRIEITQAFPDLLQYY